MIFRNSLVSAAFFALALAGCSEQRPSDKISSVPGHVQTQSAPGLFIVGDNLQPLAQAKILIGEAQDVPFAGNFLTTDGNGHVDVPVAWTAAASVTIEAPGYMRATYLAQEPGDRTYQLRRRQNTTVQHYEVKGVTQGHSIQDRDGFVDFSLVIPAMTRNDFLTFDINSVISTQMDTISVLGQEAEVPSNITFPRQKESYVFPVTLEKPTYRTYFGEGGAQKIFAARGRFPFKEVVDQLRKNAPFSTLVNYFSILGGGMRDLNLTQPSTHVDLSVRQYDFKSRASVQAPKFAGDESMMVVGVAPLAEHMVPTDVKVVKSGQKLSISILDASAMVFAVLKKTQDMDSTAPGSDRLSAVLTSATGGVAAPNFLPILADPRLASNGDVLVPAMNSIPGVHPLATYAVMSEVTEAFRGRAKVKVNSTYWEVYAKNWTDVIHLPEWPEGSTLAGQRHWGLHLIGSTNISDVDLGPTMINNATHVTHSSLDF